MHLTDEQLNEYLDHEATDRAYIEAHISSCDECAARLHALQALFAEIESLNEVTFVRPIAASFTRASSQPAQLPRWLTLTATLQCVLALIVLFTATPFVATLVPAIETPSVTQLYTYLQSQWFAWLDILTSVQIPAFPQIPVLEMPSLMLTLTLASVFVLWLVGNGLLLRKQMK